MNDPVPSNELTRLGRATRFAIVCVVLGVSYFTISSCLGISRFSKIFADVLGENETLPAITTFVLGARTVLLVLSICIPVAAVALLFTRDIVRSLYGLGPLVLIAIVEYAVLWHAKASPLVMIIEKMQSSVQ